MAFSPHITEAYCDGATIGPNPSSEGGAWAWCHVSNEKRIKEASGILLPEEVGLPTVTNNLAELVAAYLCLEALSDGWKGVIWTDSLVTFHRIRKNRKRPAAMNGIPEYLQERLAALKRALGSYTVKLLAGHPTKFDLGRGCNDKGVLVSPHNVWCDRACNSQMVLFASA